MKENMLRKMHTVAKVIKASNEANVKKLHWQAEESNSFDTETWIIEKS
jgi:hypothetical protein